MAFGPYTQPVAPAKWVDPLDLNIYAKGMAYKQELAEKNLQNLTTAYSSTFGVPAYGADARRLAELEQGFRDKIGSLNISNLSDMGTVSQLRGLINQYSSANTQEGKDLMAISKRGTFYKDELERKKEADEKGLPYYGRGLKQLEDYYNQNDFYTDPKNVSLGSGFIGVNLAKERSAVLKDVPKEKYLGKDGFYHERYNQDALKQALTGLYSDSRIQKQLTEDIQNKWDGRDWETEGVQQITDYKKSAQSLYDQAIKQNRPDVAQDALEDIQKYDMMLKDPKGYAEQIKNTVYSEELQNRINTDIEHSNFDSVDKANEYKMKSLEMANQRANKLYEMQLKTGISRNAGESEESYIQRLAQGAYEKDIAIAQAKSDITQKRQEALEEQKQANKIEILNSKKEKITINDNGAKKVYIKNRGDDDFSDKSVVLENIQREDVSTIQDIINTYPEQFGNKQGVDPQLFRKNVWFTTENGIRYANYEADDYFGGTEYRIPLTEIQKFIADPTHDITVFSEDDDYKTPIKGSTVKEIDKGTSSSSSSTSEYTNVTSITGPDGKTINAGVKDGKWYNTETNEELK